MMSDHMLMTSSDAVFYNRSEQTSRSCLFPQSPRQCSQKRLIICANCLGDLASADLGNVVLELGGDLDLGGTHVWGNSELGVQQCLTALSTRALASVPTSVFLEKSVVGSDLSDIWVLNLLVVSVFRVTVLVARMVLATFLTWVLLVTSTSTSFLVFLGAGGGSGVSF